MRKFRGSVRKEKYIIPIEAFREAIANALVHREWDVNTNINISMYEDRIEIVSPSGLPSGISKEEYLNGGLSVPRNPTICNVFMRLGLIERFGTGIRRINDIYLSNATKPRFVVTDNMIEIILPIICEKNNLTRDQQLIIDNLKKHGNMRMNSSQIMQDAKMWKTKLVALLNSLTEQGYVVKEGKGKATTYAVN